MSRPHPTRAALLALALCGCVQRPSVPIFGVWEGTPPGPAIEPSELVDLVLEGAPDAVAGHYRISTIQRGDLQFGVGTGTRRWAGRWTSEPARFGGQTLRVIQLHDTLAGDVSRYVLAANGVLVPVRGDNSLYSREQDALYGLRPVPRDSHNYGTL